MQTPGACEDRFFSADVRLLSSWHDRQAALKCSYRSDSVTRDWPVALRVRAAQAKTGKGLDGLWQVPQRLRRCLDIGRGIQAT